jgi:signal transduction histidine kinase
MTSKTHLFKSASTRLAATYLAVVMAVSFVFSLTLYRVLSRDIERSYRQSVNVIDRFSTFGMRPDNRQRMMYEQERLDTKQDSMSRLVNELLLINLAILVFGGGLCYVLARRTLQPIEEAHNALQRFTSDASHELRTPLTTMRTEIEVALMNDKITIKEAKDLLGSNLEEVDRLTHLSERLLLLARLDETELPMTTTTLDTVLQSTLQTTQQRLELKKQTLHYTPNNKQITNITADVPSLAELFVLLIDNASKYSDKGDEITLTAAQKGDSVVVQVVDKGRGIAKEDLPHIFDRFYRADSSRTNSGEHGYGLGLPLAKKIANLHGGDITVASKLGKGSTFTVTLPIM